jgi:hypothetical protein
MAEHFGIQWEDMVRLPESIHFSTFAVWDKCYVLGSLTGFLYTFSRSQSFAAKVTSAQITAVRLRQLEFIEPSVVIVGTSAGELLVERLMPTEYVCLESFQMSAEVTHLCGWKGGCVLADNKGNLSFIQKSKGPELMVTLPSDDSSVTQLQGTDDYLAVSTLKRTYLLVGSSLKQVGRKERPSGYYGACILKDSLYVGRPGGNLWRATLEGSVVSTSSFKTKTGDKIK